MAEKIRLKIDVDNAEATQKMGEVTGATEEAKEGTQELGGALDTMSGGAVSAFGVIVAGAKKAILSFRTLRGAIAATGIGLLITAVLALKSAFTGSEEGQNKFAKIMGVIGALTGNLLDLVADLGENIIWAFENPKQAINSFVGLLKDQIINRFTGLLELVPQLGKAVEELFRGNFAEAGTIAANAVGKVALGVENVTEKIEDAITATGEFIEQNKREAALAAQVADDRAKADKLERKLLVERARLENQIAQLRLQSREEQKFSAKERIEFLNEAQVLEDGLLTQEQEVLKLRSEAISLENTFARSNKANLDAEAEAQAAVLRNQAARTNSQRSTQRELNRLIKEAAAAEKAEIKLVEDEKKRIAKEELDRIKAIDAEKDVLRKENLKKELAALKIKEKQEKDAAALAAANAQTLEESKYTTALGGINALIALNNSMNHKTEAQQKRAFKTNKALQIASTVMETYKSAQSAFSALAGLGPAGPILGAAAAAVAVTAGLARVNAIKNQKFNGGGSVSTAPIASTFSAGSLAKSITPSAPAQGQFGINLENSGAGKSNITKTYVLSKDIRDKSQLETQIRRESML